MKKKEDLRIVYMGTPEFAVESLKCLVEGGYNVVGVVTMPDKPMGRHQDVLQASPVKQYAVEHGLRVLQPVKLKDEAFVEELRSLRADLQIVVAFRMLPEVVWNMPPMGTFNLHASLLPQYRGAAPINWAVLNGDAVTGVTRFSFGSATLKYGIDMLPAMIALIALTQVVQKLRDFKVAGGKLDDARKIDKQGITKKEMVSILPACLRSSAIASVLGAMPGVGGGVAQFLCYNEVRRTSKHPEEFGKGCLEGIAAAESSNNAVVGSAMIPLLTLGIPGDGVTALLLGAFVLHGIQPGPTMFTKQGVMAYTIIIGCLVANVLLAPLGLGMTRLVAKIVQVRYTYLAPVIIMFCFAGAFAATGNTKELIICAGILIFSYILTVLDIDNTPLMLGMILEDIMEQNFVTASMSYDRNYSIFITRPISAVILIITVVLLVSMIRVNRRVAKLNEQQEAQMAAEHAKMENA